MEGDSRRHKISKVREEKIDNFLKTNLSITDLKIQKFLFNFNYRILSLFDSKKSEYRSAAET